MTSSKTNIMIFVFLCAGKTMSFWTLEPSCRKKPKLHVKFSEVSHDWYTLVIFPAIYTFFDSVLNRKSCCLKKKKSGLKERRFCSDMLKELLQVNGI